MRVGTRSKNLFFSTKVNSPDAGMPGKIFTGMKMRAEEDKLLETLKEDGTSHSPARPGGGGKRT